MLNLLHRRDVADYGTILNEETGIASGWDSMWQRFTARMVAETKVARQFGAHDIRAKFSSNADSNKWALLSHAKVVTTGRHYRRKAEIVEPAARRKPPNGG
ncbi:hypothetical protein [Derxia gummosa]|uniref:Uncharacterized protein n=1 Tax=Derxia gummosa DSM 723 TaxID=1121388 RepID=A0A8B6X1B0_9BURK|nr:hypothetical protein [Derxia gummosa]